MGNRAEGVGYRYREQVGFSIFSFQISEGVLLTFRIFAGSEEKDSNTEFREGSQRPQRRRRNRNMMPGFFPCGLGEASVISVLRPPSWLRQGRAVKK